LWWIDFGGVPALHLLDFLLILMYVRSRECDFFWLSVFFLSVKLLPAVLVLFVSWLCAAFAVFFSVIYFLEDNHR